MKANTFQNKNRNTITKTLLSLGILSSVIYLFTDIFASVYWMQFYDYTSQGFSELLAFEAPTRPFVLSLTVLYNILVALFGLCICLISKKKLSLRLSGIFLIANAVIGAVTPAFFPAPMRNVEATARNIMHLPLTGTEVLVILLSIVFGAIASGKRFRVYSIFTFLMMTLFAIWGGTFVSRVAANQPTPWLGVIERGSIYAYLLWVAVLAITLLCSKNKPLLGKA
jgi:hypothetical protein